MIKNFSISILKHPLFVGSLVMVLGSNIYNAGQFVYHIIAGRILGPALYGDLAALVNILGIFGLVQISIGLTIVKFVASEKNEEKIRGLARWALLWSAGFGILIASMLAIFASYVSDFLHLSQPASVYVVAVIVLLYAIASITRSILQGLLKFGWFVTSLLSEMAIKLTLMVPLVFAGLAVIGALGAFLIGVFGSIFIGLYPLRKYVLGKKVPRPALSPLVKYSIPVLAQGIALTSIYTTDLFLVKHFFTPETAGLYAAMAKLGSIVFFGASPVTHVMFPLIAKRHAHGEEYHKIFYLSVLVIGGMAGLVVALYALIPELFLSALGTSFLPGSPMLWWFGLFMGFLAMATLLTQFYLSIGKTGIVYLFALAAIVQATLIWFIHPNILTVVQLSILSTALLTFALLVYFPYHHRLPSTGR